MNCLIGIDPWLGGRRSLAHQRRRRSLRYTFASLAL